MKCCPEFCPWRRFRQGLGPFFYANMAPETAASGHSLQQRTASQPASQEDPPLLILVLSCQNGPVLCYIVSREHYTYRPIHPHPRGQACGARAPCNVVRTGPGPRPGGDLARAALLCSPACPHSRNREAEALAFRGMQSRPL